MTDATEGAAAPPPKKRSFFKKAAWQTEAKADPGKEEDMFSHSNEFRDIVNEEKQRKKREKLLAEDKRKPKPKEHDRKRRKVSPHNEDSKEPKSGSGSSPRSCRKENKLQRRSRSPSLPAEASPTPLSAPFDPLTQSSSFVDSKKSPQKFSNVIDLGDSDSDFDEPSYKPPNSYLQSSSKPALVESDGEGEIEDPFLAELAAKARARAANTSAASGTHTGASANTEYDPIVQLLITSDIPNTKPLLIRVKCSSTLSRPRESWCKIQGFSPEMTRDVFLTWKHKVIFDSTTIKRLGITIDANGIVSVEGDSDIYTDDNLPKIHIEAWTDDVFKQMQREQAEEEAAKKRAAEEASKLVEAKPEPEPEPEPEKKRFRLFLKAKGKSEWKISVNPDTTIEHLTSAYKDSNKVPNDQPVTLLFDGERLRPMDTIADTEIDDLDAIEVHFK